VTVTPVEPDQRYDLGPILGRGGMGEVRLARDTRIDREVAVKLMHPDQRDPQTIARFFREAQIQGALEHPAVVPVHDLGIDPAGNPFFVMKRLAGVTLADVFANPTAKWPRRLLLARFVDICLAIELAHTRGIVHRDLKPANLMLGDFGEAYILDWGLARIISDTTIVVAALSGDHKAGETAAGALLGTPGYMAPEQIQSEEIGPGTDVFALGCVLYEVLAGKPALPRGVAALVVTLDSECHRPSTKAPTDREIPPELDDLCARATARERAARPSARELGEAVQAYLDGDRDLERRRELAAEHARRAEIELATAGDLARATAMAEAGRALALDPQNATAQTVLGHLLLEAPETFPAEALAAADAERIESRRAVVRLAVHVYRLVIVLGVGMIVFLNVVELWPIFIIIALAFASMFGSHWFANRKLPLRTPWMLVGLAVNCTMLGMSALVFGPLFVTPVFLIGSLASWLTQPWGYSSWVVVAAHCVPVFIVVALEALGLVPSTFQLDPHQVVLTSWVVELTPAATILVLTLSIAMQLLNTASLTLSNRRIQEHAQNRIHVQRWHLQQLLPRRKQDQESRR